MDSSSWKHMTFLIDSGADISVIATNKSLLDRNACKTVSGIGGNQLIGPKKKFCIRFTCNQNQEYDAWLSPTVLDSNQELVILGRDFLNQFDSTEFDWRKSKVYIYSGIDAFVSYIQLSVVSVK